MTRRDYSWVYDGEEYSFYMDIGTRTKEVYEDRTHVRNLQDYDIFVSDSYDDKAITDMVNFLNKLASENGLKKDEIPYFVVAFVQSLPYTSDKITTRYDDYPRYPMETLYDNGGDCEDTSILVAALLQEMDYGVVLLHLPEHIAVGVACDDDVTGAYYKYEGTKYCYLETTGENWAIGQIPSDFEGTSAQIIPIYQKRPLLDVKYNYSYQHNALDVYVNIDIIVTNTGSEKAENVVIYAALQTPDENKVWDDYISETMDIYSEGKLTYKITNLHASSGNDFRVIVQAQGDNANSDVVKSEWLRWQ
jgi:hypothetical protein